MANSEHLAMINQGVGHWGQWRKENPRIRPNLSGADLSNADLRYGNFHAVNFRKARLGRANFHMAHLDEAILSDSILVMANFIGASLNGASLRQANLNHANFDRANLTGAVLRGAVMVATKFTNCNLEGADFDDSCIDQAVFGNVDLVRAIGLEGIRHYGPSIIGLDTIYRSCGHIPNSFLIDAGVPEQFVTYASSLVASPVQFYSCFISYSSQDQAFAERLHSDLRAKNLRCWFAPEDLKIGDRFQECIEDSIRLYDKVMIVLSKASVQSRWVEREVNASREREDRENRTVLFPIRIDDAVMTAPQPWAADIRRLRHIGDFRQWKHHDRYQKSFERLVRDLKSTERTSGANDLNVLSRSGFP